MLCWINNMIKRHWAVISYLFFGALTTAVNYAVYLPLYNVLHFSAVASNCISWAVAVVFAYLTNKPFVFKNNDWALKNVIPEFLRFVGCRTGSGAVETLVIYITVDLLCWNGNLLKLFTSVFVVILNYFGSKLLVFRKKKEA